MLSSPKKADCIDQQVDVLVVGGGPAGTTAATLLARRGWSVVLLEKAQHPRFHIGESLLPMNLPILERLGVLDSLDEIGVKKFGADFTLDDDAEDYRTSHFSRALGDSAGYAYEVRRQEFDQILFENCREAGTTALENHRVTAISLASAGKRHRVECVDARGEHRTWEARYVLDASGRDTLLASRNRWKRKNPHHASAAIFGHFKGVKRRPGADAGNISLYWIPHGWIWMIPLRDDVMSVGAVCWPSYFKHKRGDAEQFLRDTLCLNEAASARIADAPLVTSVQVTGNYSYQSKRLCGPGYALLGDAYAFIDPVFSSGVYLAMNSAQRSVPLVEQWLRGEYLRYFVTQRRYQYSTRRGLRHFSWFIYRFTTPAMRGLFRNPRNTLQVQQAVISMLAGDVFDNPRVHARLRLFRFFYGVSWLLNARESFSAWRRRSKNADSRSNTKREYA